VHPASLSWAKPVAVENEMPHIRALRLCLAAERRPIDSVHEYASSFASARAARLHEPRGRCSVPSVSVLILAHGAADLAQVRCAAVAPTPYQVRGGEPAPTRGQRIAYKATLGG